VLDAWTCNLLQLCSCYCNYQVGELKEDVFGGGGGACGRRREDRTGIGWGEPGARNHLEDLSVDGRITLKWILIK